MAFSLSEQSLQAIEISVNRLRLRRYQHEGKYVLGEALQLYYWNSELCEAFYFPLQMAEVLTRNAMHEALRHRYGDSWFLEAKFINELPGRFREELTGTLKSENSRHGSAITAHHIVSGLTFGFWQHLTTTSFRHLLWRGGNNGLAHQFPNAERGASIQTLHDKIQRVRQWRNRIAHHKAIFDKDPLGKYAEILSLIGWMCADSSTLVARLCRVEAVHSKKPL